MRRYTAVDKRYDAVESLLPVYGLRILELLTNATGDSERAEELFPQVFLTAAILFETVPDEHELEMWLFAIARDVAAGNPLSRRWWRRRHSLYRSRGRALGATDAGSAPEVTEEGATEDAVVGFISTAVPHALLARTTKVLHAAAAERGAIKRHKGPMWTSYIVVVMVLLSTAAVAYGVDHSNTLFGSPGPTVPASTASNSGTSLPVELGSLPVTIVGQMTLSSSKSIDLSHAAVDGETLYLPQLQSTPDTWPSFRVDKISLAPSGTHANTSPKTMAVVQLVDPVLQAGKPEAYDPWTVTHWKMVVTGSWAVFGVQWNQTEQTQQELLQLYLLYLPTHASALVKSIAGQPGSPDSIAWAVGSGRVAVQSEANNPSRSGGSAVSLPIQVYRLTGSSPLRALADDTQIAAPFGLMRQPVLTDSGLLFEGISGHPDSPAAPNETWYSLSWTGQLMRLQGPPLDDQPHWIAPGLSGDAWWVETTPAGRSGSPQAVQVLMGELVNSSGQAASTGTSDTTLANPVDAFGVSGGRVMWIRTTNQKSILTIARVQ